MHQVVIVLLERREAVGAEALGEARPQKLALVLAQVDPGLGVDQLPEELELPLGERKLRQQVSHQRSAPG